MIALADFGVFSQQHDAHLGFFQVQCKTHDAVRKFEKLTRHDLLQAVNPGYTVADGNDTSNLADIDPRSILLDLFSNNLADFVCFDLHEPSLSTLLKGGS